MPKTRKREVKIESIKEEIQVEQEENVNTTIKHEASVKTEENENTTIKHEASVKTEENEENFKTLLKKHDRNGDLNFTDSGFFCQTCGETFVHKRSYRSHQLEAHQVEPKKRQRTKKLPDMALLTSSKDFSCLTCKLQCNSQEEYVNHMLHQHFLSVEHATGHFPEETDPNKYCLTCHRPYKTKPNYYEHLRLNHKIIFTGFLDIPPDLYDADNYCRSCKTSFTTRRRYIHHVNHSHQIKVTPLKLNTVPDAYDPDNYCKACRRSYGTKPRYRAHLKRVHDIKVTPL